MGTRISIFPKLKQLQGISLCVDSGRPYGQKRLVSSGCETPQACTVVAMVKANYWLPLSDFLEALLVLVLLSLPNHFLSTTSPLPVHALPATTFLPVHGTHF